MQNSKKFFFDVRPGEKTLVTLLFLNFYLIITAYYIVKSFRGAVVIQSLGADALPYVWIATMVFMTFFVGVYGKMVDLLSRPVLVFSTIIFFLVSLLAVRFSVGFGHPWSGALFYVWSDIFSVVMVEQFWSFNNDVFSDSDAKRLYGLIGSGGILGGMTGGAIVALIAPIVGTMNMAYVCAALLAVLAGMVFAVQKAAEGRGADLARSGAAKPEVVSEKSGFWEGFKLVATERYLACIAAALLLSQIAATIIDFQFNKAIEIALPGLDEKSAYMGGFFVVMNAVSFVLMTFSVAPILKRFGVKGGLSVLPFTDIVTSLAYFAIPWHFIICGAALFDKSLSYSVNRASRELLYIPLSRDAKYKAKAVIDMLGFRISHVLGSAVIIPLAAYALLPWLGVLNAALLAGLTAVNWSLARQQKSLSEKPQVELKADPVMRPVIRGATSPALRR